MKPNLSLPPSTIKPTFISLTLTKSYWGTKIQNVFQAPSSVVHISSSSGLVFTGSKISRRTPWKHFETWQKASDQLQFVPRQLGVRPVLESHLWFLELSLHWWRIRLHKVRKTRQAVPQVRMETRLLQLTQVHLYFSRGFSSMSPVVYFNEYFVTNCRLGGLLLLYEGLMGVIFWRGGGGRR